MADKIILGNGKELIFSTNSEITGLNNNILVTGSSGCGKSTSVVEPILLQTKERNLVVTVTKKGLVKKYTKLFKERGYNVYDLDFVHPEQGNIAYDPLDFINSFSDISFIARSLVMANKKQHNDMESYWTDATISLLTAIISYILIKKKNATFNDVIKMLQMLSFEDSYSGLVRTNYDDSFELLKGKDGLYNYALMNWSTFVKLPIKTASCIYSSLNTTIDTIFTPEVCQIFTKQKKVDFGELASKKTVIFVTTSPVNQSLNSFVNMFYATTFKELFEYAEEKKNGKLPISVHVIADDMATGCPIPFFDNYISIFREKNISCTILIQSESQLSSLYGHSGASTIINNCDSYIFMGSNDLSTAQNIAIRCNKKVKDILELKVGKQLIFRRGMPYIETERYDVKNDIRYQKLSEEYEN